MVRPLPRLLAVVAALALAGLTVGCTPGAAESDPPPGSSASETPTESDAPEPSEEPEPEPTSFSDADRDVIKNAIASGDLGALEPYLRDMTRFTIAASETDVELPPAELISALDYVQPGVGTWNWNLPADQLAAVRESIYYGVFFAEDAIVGQSSEGPVIAMTVVDGTFTMVFVSADFEILLF